MDKDNGEYTILNKALKGEKLDDVFIIDAHGHLDMWKSANVTDKESSAEGLISNMDRIGIDKLCINKWNSPDTNANKDVAIALRKYPENFLGFATVFPSLGTKRNLEELNRCFDEYGFTGVKVHNSYTQLQIRDHTDLSYFKKTMDSIWRFIAERHCPVLCHGYLTPKIAKRYPEGIFITAHAGGVPNASERFSDCDNVFLDTAASNLLRGNIKNHIKHVGDERIFYGSDMPYADPGFRIGQVIASGLPDRILRKILGLNIARVLNIDIPEKYKKSKKD